MEARSRTERRKRVLKMVAALGIGVLACALGQNLQGQQRPPVERGPMRNPHGPLTIPCAGCHTSTSWTPIRAIPEFDHNRETSFPLRAMHQGVPCRLCHASLMFRQVGTKCAACHADIHRAQFGSRCEECHTVKGWRVGVQSVRNHSARFPLIGGHAAANCEACHRGAGTAQFTGLSIQCLSCHMKDLNSAASVLDHRAAGFPATCEQCHGIDSWRALKFDHGRFTGFELIGPHARLDCASCHIGNRFKGTPADCFSCHAKDFNSAADPNHVSAGFPHDCTVCHTALSWANASFNHNAATKFALTGAHASVNCAACHIGGRFAGTPADCYSCHLKDFQNTKNPDHRAGNFPTDCSRCHNTTNWQNATFDHSLTKFPLSGAHATLQCTQCHVNNQFNNTPAACASCHLADFRKAASPNHVAAGFPQDCSLCHTTTQWKGATFNHNALTKFPLTGAHVQVACTQCHANNRFAGTPTDCASCHLANFQQATNPNHVTGGFPQTCEVCHNTSAWQPASFDHSKTVFPLTGAHVQATCAQCHVNNKFAGTPTQCQACHLDTFNKTTNPNHVAAGFPQDCSICHSTVNWQGAKFDHSTTKFPLTGAHIPLNCAQCHVNNKFAGLATTCVSCHLSNFQQAANPNHVAAGFPQQCEVCHTTAAWRPASFNHNNTRFPLTGAHTTVACTSCHLNGVFAGTPTDCYSCHKVQYDTTTTLNHKAAGFPTTCAACHTTASWSGATFDHTKFPIYTGSHAGRWTSCADCHTNPNDYTVFSCITCHAHDKTTTDGHHTDVRNYVYAATTCYSCHPTGRAGD